MNDFDAAVKAVVIETLGLKMRSFFVGYELEYERCTGGDYYPRNYVRFNGVKFAVIDVELSRNSIAENLVVHYRRYGETFCADKRKTLASLKRLEKSGFLRIEKVSGDYKVIITLSDEYRGLFECVKSCMKNRISKLSGESLRKAYFAHGCIDEIVNYVEQNWPAESLKK